ncbi:unnamed protein product [Pleuronectes platessa]|uniref:C-type lectin domain-containing protein n=1 Tax=Pleuronectes platessa TaxID=8262 RepID=A0A9N7TTV9_PLEPL|nr:unnamed protein product [Pleuronectes platessa]
MSSRHPACPGVDVIALHFINGLFGNNRVWIGLADEGVEGVWKWVDGTPLTLEFWAADQPNSYKGTDQDCVEFWHRASGKAEWNDENSKRNRSTTTGGELRSNPVERSTAAGRALRSNPVERSAATR